MRKEDRDRQAAAALMGKQGGKARAKSLTPERRKEIAQAAARKRWGDKAKESQSAS
jgi:hypothetical protein